MIKLTATFRIVTPMFLGGAEHELEPRLTSFKGALRFWWRALMWSRVRGIEGLREQEARLFGNSGKHGQSQVIMRIAHSATNPAVDAASWRLNSWENYTGYGLRDSERKALASPAEFTVCMTAKSPEVFSPELLDALSLFGLVGGLGARSRNGWGSITLSELQGAAIWNAPRTKTELEREIKRLVTSSRNAPEIPPFTALSTQSEFAVGKEFENPEIAQRKLGEFYKASVQQMPKDSTRWQFGIPRHSKRAELRNTDRRAKPLFLHIHQASGGKAIPVALFLPAQFTEHAQPLPNNGMDARTLVREIPTIE